MNNNQVPLPLPRNEKGIIFVLFCIQFVNILDAMMVMPLGPDLSKAFNLPNHLLGLIGGSYTASACLSSLFCGNLFDRFERKKIMQILLIGLSFSTFLGGLSFNYWQLIASRILAGAFGGPAAALTLTIVSDLVPEARRGKAMGIIMSGFSLASILGVPLGLELARIKNWSFPFYFIGLTCIAVLFWASLQLPLMYPPQKNHLRDQTQGRWYFKKNIFLALMSIAFSTLGVMLIVPNMSAFLQMNLAWPREKLGFLYLIGGAMTIITNPLSGKWIDLKGVAPVILTSTIIFLAVIITGFIFQSTWIPIVFLLPLFMLSTTMRFVAISTLCSRIPKAQDRGKFMGLQNSWQQAMSAIGSLLPILFLSTGPKGKLIGMETIAIIAAILAFFIPFIIIYLENRIKLKN